MEKKEIEFEFGKLIFEFQNEQEQDKFFVGEAQVSLILNDDFLKKFKCFSLNYRGSDEWRLKDKDFEMLFKNIQNEQTTTN